jgi:threonine/homoserine/homoserine lactone efflux protein
VIEYLIFAAAFMASAITPGADTALVFSRSVTSGLRAGLTAGLGVAAAKMLAVTLAFFSLSALLLANPELLLILKILGATFLLYRAGVLIFRKGTKPVESAAGGFSAGFTIGLGNPQPLAFYLAVMPAVAGKVEWLPLMAIVLAGFMVVSLLYGYLGSAVREKLSLPEAAINRAVAVIFVVLAAVILLR